MPTSPNARVLVGGQPTSTIAAPYSVAGCALPPNAGGPCVTGQWIAGTTRVTSNGQPLVVFSGTAICTPTGTPLVPVQSQTRVMGT